MKKNWRRKCRLLLQNDLFRNPCRYKNILATNFTKKLVRRLLCLLILLAFCNIFYHRFVLYNQQNLQNQLKVPDSTTVLEGNETNRISSAFFEENQPGANAPIKTILL